LLFYIRSMKKLISLILMLFAFTVNLFAQQNVEAVEMADQMRSDGKIYVVVAVVLVVLLGIFIYLTRLDSRISKAEKELKQ